MIVDDDQDWIESLTDFLVEEGYTVTAAPNGVVALENLSRMEPLVVITDVEMPIMDGRRLLAMIRGLNGRIPVIVVTGEGIGHCGAAASLAGAFRIIRKPVPVEDLLSAITDAATHRADHLPLKKLWLAAAPVSRSRANRVLCSGWSAIRRVAASTAAAPIVGLLFLASSFALFNHWRAIR